MIWNFRGHWSISCREESLEKHFGPLSCHGMKLILPWFDLNWKRVFNLNLIMKRQYISHQRQLINSFPKFGDPIEPFKVIEQS